MKTSFKIWQIDTHKNSDNLFEDYYYTNAPVRISDYRCVFECTDTKVEIDLEKIFWLFQAENIEMFGTEKLKKTLSDNKARSISVSDVIEYEDNLTHEREFWYADSLGFTKLRNNEFLKGE